MGLQESLYRDEYCELVVKFMQSRFGLTLTAFAGSIGVSRVTVTNWRKKFPDFDEACKRAHAVATMHQEKKLIEQIDGNCKGSTNALVFALKNIAPEDWKEKNEVENTGGMKLIIEDYRTPTEGKNDGESVSGDSDV